MVELVAILVILTIGLILLIAFRPALTRTQGGKILAFVALFVLPVASMRAGFRLHFESTKETSFCLSCHVMEPYGESLLVADDSFLPAAHFQNRRVDRKYACFECHTQYTIFGGMKAKMRGLRHAWVYYTGQAPEKIEPYSPLHNRECLYCHTGSRDYEELHEDDKAELMNNEGSCMECHGRMHEVATVDAAPKWKPTIQEMLDDLKGFR